MPHIFGRYHRVAPATILAGEAESNFIKIATGAIITLHMPAAWTAASIGFKASPTKNGTYNPVYNENDVLVQVAGADASKVYVAPAEAGAPRFIKIWSQNGSGTDTNQVAEAIIQVEMKA